MTVLGTNFPSLIPISKVNIESLWYSLQTVEDNLHKCLLSSYMS